MLFKQTIADVRSDLTEQAQEIRRQLADVGDVVAIAVVIVGALAVTALVVALVRA